MLVSVVCVLWVFEGVILVLVCGLLGDVGSEVGVVGVVVVVEYGCVG